MTQPVQLVPRPARVREDVITMLETWLADAKAGELSGVAIAGVMPDGSIRHGWSDCDQTPLLVGAIARLQHRISNSMDSSTIEPTHDRPA